jgi:uncharacterized protein YegJ (DUF2314 family)
MRSAIITAPLSIAMLVAIAACEGPDGFVVDPVASVSGQDQEMNLAISKARDSLPLFWKVFEAPGRGESDFALKVRVEDRNGVEHFWVTDLRRQDGKIFGFIGNDANTVASVKFGDEIEVLEDDISDWLYMRNGKMVGNFTVRPLFKQMPDAEVERLKSMLADP